MRPTSIPTPVDLIHAVDLPTGAKETWLLLRLLAGEADCTPAASPFELCQLTGKSRTTLYEHLKRLEAQGFLHTRLAGRRLVVCFPAETSLADVSAADAPAAGPPDPVRETGREPGETVPKTEQPAAGVQNSAPERPKPVRNTGSQPPCVQNLEPKSAENPDSEPLFKELNDSSGNSGGKKRARRSDGRNARGRSDQGRSDHGQPDLQTDDPIQIYRDVFNFRPTPPQREEVYVQVHDPALWRSTLEHWRLHAWSPRNLPGILDLYARGGPPACHACIQPAARRSAAQPASAGRGDPLDDLRRKQAREAYLMSHDAFADPPDAS